MQFENHDEERVHTVSLKITSTEIEDIFNRAKEAGIVRTSGKLGELLDKLATYTEGDF